MTNRNNLAVASAVRIGLNRQGDLGWKIIEYVKSEWSRVSQDCRENIRLQVEKKLPEFELVDTEVALLSLFTNEKIPPLLGLRYTNAKKWIDFYDWITKPRPRHSQLAPTCQWYSCTPPHPQDGENV